MPRGLRKKTKQYVLDRFQEEDPEEYFKYKTKPGLGLTTEQTEFIQAVEDRSVQRVSTMLGRGVDPNFFVARHRKTPLHVAVEILETKRSYPRLDGRVNQEPALEKIMGNLLFFGADVNFQDDDGSTPLHVACLCGNLPAVRLLLQAGADVNARDNYKDTPLLNTWKHPGENFENKQQIFYLLLSHNANVTYKNCENQTVLQRMLEYFHSANWEEDRILRTERHHMIESLLRLGLAANQVNEAGVSLLCNEVIYLLRSGRFTEEAAPDLIQPAIVLICGGAVLQSIPDCCKLESHFRSIRGGDRQALLTTLVRVFCLLKPHVSQSQLSCFCAITEQLCQRLYLQPPLNSFDVQLNLQSVRTLSQLSKLQIRQCLGGKVMSTADKLPLPEKFKTYICSGE